MVGKYCVNSGRDAADMLMSGVTAVATEQEDHVGSSTAADAATERRSLHDDCRTSLPTNTVQVSVQSGSAGAVDGPGPRAAPYASYFAMKANGYPYDEEPSLGKVTNLSCKLCPTKQMISSRNSIRHFFLTFVRSDATGCDTHPELPQKCLCR